MLPYSSTNDLIPCYLHIFMNLKKISNTKISQNLYCAPQNISIATDEVKCNASAA